MMHFKYVEDGDIYEFEVLPSRDQVRIKAFGCDFTTQPQGLDVIIEYEGDQTAWLQFAQQELLDAGLIEYHDRWGWHNVDDVEELRAEDEAEDDYRQEVSSPYLSGRI